MPALNFKAMFRPKIEDGSKRHTIRARRKRIWKVGDPLALYTGMRTKACRLIFRTVVTQVEEISIAVIEGDPYAVILLGQQTLAPDEMEAFARADGFADHAEMMRFWRENNTLPFHGHVIHWKFPGEVRA